MPPGAIFTCDLVRPPVKQETQVVQRDALVLAMPQLLPHIFRKEPTTLGMNMVAERTICFLSAWNPLACAFASIRLSKNGEKVGLTNFGGSGAVGVLGLALLAAKL